MSIETILRDELNIVGPMRHIFGDEIGDALEVLLAQEAEHVAHLIRAALTGDEAVETVVDALVMDPISSGFGTQIEPVRRAARAAIAALVETIGGRS